MAKLENGATTYFHRDHLSARVLTNASGTVVGELDHYPGACPERSRRERDGESGNDYTTGRTYASNLGRFLSPDLAPAALGDPQSWNRYTYVQNDPVNGTDPSGWCNEAYLDSDSGGGGFCWGGGGEDVLALLGEWADPFGFLGMQIGTSYTFSGPAGFPFESYGLDDLRFFAKMGNDLYNIRSEGMNPIFSPSMFWFGTSGLGGGKNDFPPLTEGAPLAAAQQAVKMAQQLTSQEKCDKALSGYGVPSLGSLANQFVLSGNGANVFDARTSTLMLSDGKTVAQEALAEKASTGAMVPNGVTGPAGGKVTFLGYYFFDPPSIQNLTAQRAIMMLHEAVHQFGGKGDSVFDTSQKLSRIIIDNCFPVLKGKLGGVG